MLKFIRLVVLLALVGLSAKAATVTFSWNANTESDLAGYRFHSGLSSRVYTNSVNVGLATSYTVTNFPYDVTGYFAVTAYNTSGLESDLSNELFVNIPTPVPPGVPTSLAVLGRGFGKAGVQFTYTDATAGLFRVFTNSTFMLSVPKTTNQLVVVDLPGLSPTIAYAVQVSAVGTNGLESAKSLAVTVKIPASTVLKRD